MNKGTVIGLIVAAVVVTAAGVLWLALPNPRRKEAEVVESLKEIAQAQVEYKGRDDQSPRARDYNTDQDNDGLGEYGLLAELAGRIVRRRVISCRPWPYEPMQPPLIRSEFGSTREPPLGIAEVSGYYYQVWLPGRRGPITDTWSDATEDRPPSDRLDPGTERAIINQQEAHFIVYAWPVEYGKTGIATYAINEQGECYRTAGRQPSARRYSGTTLMPEPDAAFAKGEAAFTGKLANGEGNDGTIWEPVEREATFDRAPKPTPHTENGNEQDTEKRPGVFHRRGRRDPFE